MATPMKEIPEEKIDAYYNLCRNLKLHITESNPYENAQVSAGGVDVREKMCIRDSSLVDSRAEDTGAEDLDRNED